MVQFRSDFLSVIVGAMTVLSTGDRTRGDAPVFELVTSSDAITVRLNGALFTRYITQSGKKPILWPVIGPTGKTMTRAYPMRDTAGESTMDHPHHRSIWFGHGSVNGIDFWSEANGSGTIRHVDILHMQSSPEPFFVVKNEWLSEDGTKVCTDYREIRFGADDQRRWIDFDVTFVNDTTTPVTFGDTKEGTFGVRVTDEMRVDQGLGGMIVNSLGAKNKDAWGTTASWVDYHGPVSKEWVGIAVLNHPSSFRFPTYWHVRTYGLLAANVFGVHNFKNSRQENGAFVLQPGQRIPLYYRVILHRGDEKQGRIPEAFAEYVKVDKAVDGIQPSSMEQVPLVQPDDTATARLPAGD